MDQNQSVNAEQKKSNMMPVIVGVLLLLLVGGGVLFLSSQNKTPATTQNQDTTTEAMEEKIAAPTAVTETTPDEGAAMSEEDGVKTFTVDATNYAFSVKEMRVKKGDTVKIVFNNTEGFHDWVLDEFNAETKQLPAGQSETVEFTADEAGTFEYYCSVGNHRKMGMKGSLIVEE